MLRLEFSKSFLGFASNNLSADLSGPIEIAGPTITLRRFDAFITTAISCFGYDASDSVGGHRQKRYHKIFIENFLLP